MEESKELITYRLEEIEKKLVEMNSLVKNSILQEKDIKEIRQEMAQCKEEIKVLKEDLNSLKQQPAKNKANWFDKVVDYIFKLLVIGAVGYIIKQFPAFIQQI